MFDKCPVSQLMFNLIIKQVGTIALRGLHDARSEWNVVNSFDLD